MTMRLLKFGDNLRLSELRKWIKVFDNVEFVKCLSLSVIRVNSDRMKYTRRSDFEPDKDKNEGQEEKRKLMN